MTESGAGRSGRLLRLIALTLIVSVSVPAAGLAIVGLPVPGQGPWSIESEAPRGPVTAVTRPSPPSASAATASRDSQPAGDEVDRVLTVAAETTAVPAPMSPTTTILSTTTPETTTSATTIPTTTTPSTGAGDACFRPTFRDDFDRSELGDSWHVYRSAGSHSPNAERSPDAVSLVDGMLVITAENDENGRLLAGGLRHVGSQTYGRFAVRVRTGPDASNSTSGVVLTWPQSNDQPRDGENNFYETLRVPGDRSRFFSFIHEPFDDRADGVSQTEFVHRADASQWQTVTMEWTPDAVTITREGPGATVRETNRLLETADDLITDAEHFLAIQLDGFEPSLPAGQRVTMEVDWVEISSWCGTP